jgi:predicted RNA-binding Zn-ribbon protein involved in translation (DUF1610 family)
MKLELKYIGASQGTYIFYCNICNARVELKSKEIDYKYCPYCGKKVGEEYEI